MAINKIIYGNNTLMDITDTSATPEGVVEGQVFYSADGVRSTGTLTDATTSTHGLMSTTDKTNLDELVALLNALGLSVDAQGYVCQTISNS